jgi:uncharacterized lipoprotein YmbA
MFLILRRIFLATLVLLMLAACSNSEDQKEKGSIRQTTDKIANEATGSIKTPIEQAELAKRLAEQHNAALKKDVSNQ